MHMKRYISFLLAVLMLVTLVPTAAFADAAEADMKASDNLKLLIKGWEGLRLTAYKAHPSENTGPSATVTTPRTFTRAWRSRSSRPMHILSRI